MEENKIEQSFQMSQNLVKKTDKIQTVKAYSSLGQAIANDDAYSLKYYLEETKKADGIKDYLIVEEHKPFCVLDELLWHCVKFEENKNIVEIVNILVDYGANLNCKDLGGTTFAMNCAYANNVKLLNLLFEKNLINLDEEDYGFHDIAYYAVQQDGVEVLGRLMDMGYNPEKQDLLGRTVFHFAAGIPAEKCIDLLIERKVNPTIKDYSNENAFPSQIIPSGEDFDDLYEKIEQYTLDWENGLVSKDSKKTVFKIK